MEVWNFWTDYPQSVNILAMENSSSDRPLLMYNWTGVNLMTYKNRLYKNVTYQAPNWATFNVTNVINIL